MQRSATSNSISKNEFPSYTTEELTVLFSQSFRFISSNRMTLPRLSPKRLSQVMAEFASEFKKICANLSDSKTDDQISMLWQQVSIRYIDLVLLPFFSNEEEYQKAKELPLIGSQAKQEFFSESYLKQLILKEIERLLDKNAVDSLLNQYVNRKSLDSAAVKDVFLKVIQTKLAENPSLVNLVSEQLDDSALVQVQTAITQMFNVFIEAKKTININQLPANELINLFGDALIAQSPLIQILKSLEVISIKEVFERIFEFDWKSELRNNNLSPLEQTLETNISRIIPHQAHAIFNYLWGIMILQVFQNVQGNPALNSSAELLLAELQLSIQSPTQKESNATQLEESFVNFISRIVDEKNLMLGKAVYKFFYFAARHYNKIDSLMNELSSKPDFATQYKLLNLESKEFVESFINSIFPEKSNLSTFELVRLQQVAGSLLKLPLFKESFDQHYSAKKFSPRPELQPKQNGKGKNVSFSEYNQVQEIPEPALSNNNNNNNVDNVLESKAIQIPKKGHLKTLKAKQIEVQASKSEDVLPSLDWEGMGAITFAQSRSVGSAPAAFFHLPKILSLGKEKEVKEKEVISVTIEKLGLNSDREFSSKQEEERLKPSKSKRK